MPKARSVTAADWISVIKSVTDCPPQVSQMDRRKAFDATLALLRGGVSGQASAPDQPFGILEKCMSDVTKIAVAQPEVARFLDSLRKIQLKSLGIHIVDPIAGRLSAIWVQANELSPNTLILAQVELYSRVWNDIYRRLFRPSATLINAIESGILSWKLGNIQLKMWHEEPFFCDTIQLASELKDAIARCLPSNPDPRNPRDVGAAEQLTWNELKKSDFIVRLDRIATRFRDAVIDDPEKKAKFCDYLKGCASGSLPDSFETVLNAVTAKDTSTWSHCLDLIQAIQSSILSQPVFCDEHGLWIHRADFSKFEGAHRTSVYFIFGLAGSSNLSDRLAKLAKEGFDQLAKALEYSIIKTPPLDVPQQSQLVTSLHRKIDTYFDSNPPNYCHKGIQRWLCAVEKLMKEAKHEGHPITYNVGYGSLAYAQSHLHRYEPAPDDLGTHDAPVEKISSYVKGFYSIFGKRADRGLWFDELGGYCGVYESGSGRAFEKTAVAGTGVPDHATTVLFAKIDGAGTLDILSLETNQIARVKNGELVDMVSGDNRRNKAMESLSDKIISWEYRDIAKWLVNELVEVLQVRTHGTSFILSFPENISAPSHSTPTPDWRSKIKSQTKTLTRNLSKLDAPLATFHQLSAYASSPCKPEHLFGFLAELANLDGGLWLDLSSRGLEVRAAQQFIPLLKLGEEEGLIVRPLDLQMELMGTEAVTESFLPSSDLSRIESAIGLKSLFSAINGRLKPKSEPVKKYVKALSLLHHSGTKTHSLWGMSITASEPCLCVVISSDGNVYIFHDGREFIGLQG